MSEHDDQTHAQENVEAQSADVQIKIPDSVRRAALALTDAADRVADWLEDGLREMWRIPSEPEVEVEAVEEEAEAESPES